MSDDKSTGGQNAEEQRIILPPGDTKPLDAEALSTLLFSALHRTHADLLTNEYVPDHSKLIYRHVGGDYREDQLSAPNYYKPVLMQIFDRVWNTPEFSTFVDYLWERGALKGQYSGPSKPLDEWRKSFARTVFADFVHVPLLKAFERTARERLVATGHVRAWEADPEQITLVVRDLVDWSTRKQHTATAFCMMCVRLPEGADYQFAPDIRLRNWSPQERCVFMTEHHARFSNDLRGMPLDEGTTAIAEFVTETPRTSIWTSPHPAIEPLLSAVDLLKWSMFVALKELNPVAEGICIIQGRNGIIYDTVHRGPEYFAFPVLIDEEAFGKCKSLVTRFRAVEKTTNDVSMALWHFGRACTAHLERDVLLEAAIGLELLVASGPGENSYRFRLHGASLLTEPGTSGTEVHEKLKKIYEQRSKAAHGNAKGGASPLARDARRLLARAIYAVITLVETKQLDVSKGVAAGVQQLVLRKATVAIQEIPPHEAPKRGNERFSV
ncbi:MAG: uncharacterized protein JWM10_3484 [Myxococcaceae bacterium]|nr:uncharacterized protein [Myxococcaceae bacterium]